ncbi:hypothetical protein GQF61_06655 [Sphingobacterium sp. DK4209]|uniref:DoxX family protein n=1 Tax=Sphingobacterium zhuxiongii TaxID=2662364 RepID=A0A5Q0QDP2_9SPHI|nr:MULTISPECIES: hypothetical protein [unclassified Sphingobacterium]MVZ65531.1 hypothetical protein [Sphingobacterium sp. DK4209]QGA27656.1 hypothetical protein GFH32_15625 [Sphingobacterium sp. dk4302]
MHTKDDNTSAMMFPKQAILFRFCFLMIGLFILLLNNHTFLFLTPIFPFIHKVLTVVIEFLTADLIKIDQTIPYYKNGSGDTTMHWLILLFIIGVSLIGTLVWSLFDRRTTQYPKLYYWLTVSVRYYVGITMFNYGIIKLFHGQFPFPSLYKLTEPLYLFSPMGLAWTFYGASPAYNIAIGIAEILGALLLFRKTATIGAMISLIVCINVMATNYFYDVPVKMLSTALVILCIYLLGPNLKQLYLLFIANKEIRLIPNPHLHATKPWQKIVLISLKSLLIFGTLILALHSVLRTNEFLKTHLQKESELYGVYYIPVNEYENRKKLGIPDQWHLFVFINNHSIMIRDQEQNGQLYQIVTDSSKKELKIIGKQNERTQYFQYEVRSNGIMLKGLERIDSISIFINKIDMENIDLKNRGFRWISDMSYNR